MISATIVADSINELGVRIVTSELTLPRCVLSELNTHRMKSSNAASSRAIPAPRLWSMTESHPFIPDWRLNQKGMQPGEQLSAEDMAKADKIWLDLMIANIEGVKKLDALKVHKGYINRPIEPWMWVTVVYTTTTQANQFYLRSDKAAEPSYQALAYKWIKAYKESTPRKLTRLDWHLPYVTKDIVDQASDLTFANVRQFLSTTDLSKKAVESYTQKRFENWFLQDVCAGICGSVSYLRQGETQPALNRLRTALKFDDNDGPIHFSAFEHSAQQALFGDMMWLPNQLEIVQWPHSDPETKAKPGEVGYCGPLLGWKSYRKFWPNEFITDFEGIR